MQPSALAAAQAVARAHGVACDEAVLIAAGSNALVHLKPAPVVARVMTATAVLHDDAEPWLAREVAVGAFLAERTDLVVFESSLPAQALHGDASIGNLLRTDSGGLVWNDLEDVCVGPVQWDIAGLVASARARGHGEKFVEELLAGYGEPGVEGLETFLEAHALYDVIWQAFRRPTPTPS